MKQPILGSLFTGIGGIDIAFEAAGFEVAWQVENEPYAVSVLEALWPEVARYGDIREVAHSQGVESEFQAAGDGRQGPCRRSEEAPIPITVLAGGFPCQDISLMGGGAGIEAGVRSGLWREFARLIGELRPRVVFVENVPAIASRGGARVVGDLAALGYDASWGIISAADAGAWHWRKRWWCVAHATGGGAEPEEFPWQCNVVEPRRQADDGDGEDAADAESQRGQDGQTTNERQGRLAGGGVVADPGRVEWRGRASLGPHPDGTDDRVTQPRLVRVADGIPIGLDGSWWGPGWEEGAPRVARGVKNRTARLRCLGNAVVPQVVYPIAVAIRRLLLQKEGT